MVDSLEFLLDYFIVGLLYRGFYFLQIGTVENLRIQNTKIPSDS